MDIGSNLNKARKLKGLSQEELANSLNVSRQCVSLWETNQTVPTLENLLAISEALEVNISVLTGQQPFPSSSNKKEEMELEKQKNIEALRSKDAKVFTILAMILSILSTALFLVPILGFLVALASIVFSILAKKNKSTIYNTISLIMGSVYLFASIVTLVYYYG